MSEKSFAVISVAIAVVCGVFFYPPPPPERAQQLQPPQQHLSRNGANPPARELPPGRTKANDASEHGWWRTKLAQLKPSANLLP